MDDEEDVFKILLPLKEIPENSRVTKRTGERSTS